MHQNILEEFESFRVQSHFLISLAILLQIALLHFYQYFYTLYNSKFIISIDHPVFFSFIFPSRYLASTTIDPSAVHISSRMSLLMGSFVISKIAYSRREFLRSFSKKYRASSSSDPNTLVR